MFALWNSVRQRIGASVCRLSHATSYNTPALTQSSAVSTLSLPKSDHNLSHRILAPSTSCLHSSVFPTAQNVTAVRHGSFFSQCRKNHLTGVYGKVKRKKKSAIGVSPQMRGVVLRTLVKKPKKPNSANRKCVRLRLTNGKEVTAYVPGEGHSLQEHNIVLVTNGRLQDTPGVKLTCIRGKYDLPHVKKRIQ